VRGAPDQIQYTNAKVLLVGESGVGKTGLSQRLGSDSWEPSDSTVGAWATQWKLPVASGDGVEREIWLWDFGGQADQRLVHQLYMEIESADDEHEPTGCSTFSTRRGIRGSRRRLPRI
jgi:GTPase SAR1 family protein